MQLPTPPRRRWFQFTLRTLFVVATAFGVWLGWERHRVAEREAVAQLVLARHGVIDNSNEGNADFLVANYQLLVGDKPNRIPRIWLYMGARPIQRLMVPLGEFSLEERRRIKAAFPELDGEGNLRMKSGDTPIPGFLE
jgi:hypothetical protein